MKIVSNTNEAFSQVDSDLEDCLKFLYSHVYDPVEHYKVMFYHNGSYHIIQYSRQFKEDVTIYLPT